MADSETKRAKLTEEQKTEVRALVAKYKQGHPEANLKEILGHLDVPYKQQVTEGVLRGLAERHPSGAGRARGGRRPAVAETRVPSRTGGRGGARGPRGSRGRPVERVIADLNALRRRREDLDGQIAELETELRGRMHQQLGVEHAGRIFGGLLDRLGDTAQRVGSSVGDTAQKVTSTVGDRLGDATGRASGGDNQG